MKRISIYFLFFCVVLGFSSCSSMYMPNVPATPMFKEQGETYLAGHVNIKGNISGTAGVAITDNIAILANGSTVNYGVNSNEYFKQQSVEGAVGYFTKVGKEKRQILEVYAGYGIGNSLDKDQRATVIGFEPVETREMDFDKLFIQVNYSSMKKKKINLFGGERRLNYGTVFRLSKVGMKEFSINNVATEKEENFFIEPLFFTRLEVAKGLQVQYTNGFNIPMMSNQYLKAGNAVFTLGLVYNFWK